MTAAEWAPPDARPLVAKVVAAVQADPRIVGLTVGGSAAEGTMDEFSDLDFVVICRDEHQPELLRFPGWTSRWQGRLRLTGERRRPRRHRARGAAE